VPVERRSAGDLYADSGAVAIVLRPRLYQMIPIWGEAFVTDAGEPQSIIVVWRWNLLDGAQAERTRGVTCAETTISNGGIR